MGVKPDFITIYPKFKGASAATARRFRPKPVPSGGELILRASLDQSCVKKHAVGGRQNPAHQPRQTAKEGHHNEVKRRRA